MVSYLTSCFGPENLSLAEDVVQETLAKALGQWPYRGVPQNPSAWLLTVARNRALDILRVERNRRSKVEELGRIRAGEAPAEPRLEDPMFRDDQLRMMFLCCHPTLSPESQVALVLKTLCGFSVEEIARGLRAKETAIAQRLVRAKNAIRESGIPFEIPSPDDVTERLEVVYHALYQLFTKGYAEPSGADLVSRSLCEDAIYLASMLAENPLTETPVTHALLALFHFQAARLLARTDSAGELLLLEDQDRSLWDRGQIERGFRHLNRAMRAESPTRFHLEAGIAACHAGATTYEDTDWRGLLELYDALVELTHSPIAALNRAVAAARVHGPQRGLEALDRIRDSKALEDYYLLPATYGALYQEIGDCARGAACYHQALQCPCNEPEHRFLQRRIASVS